MREKNFPITRFFGVLILVGCSSRVQAPVDPRPAWLKGESSVRGYYTGLGHARKEPGTNYVQMARKSALNDLISQIKVTVSGTSVLSTVEENRKDFRERYEQIIRTSAADEIEEFEEVGNWEDEHNYWVFYRLSVDRYRELKEAQKRNAVTLALDFVRKARVSEQERNEVQALTFYLQGLRMVEKYLGDAIPVQLDGREVLLTNEIFASVQRLLGSVRIRVNPPEVEVNRRVGLKDQPLMVLTTRDDGAPVRGLPLSASFIKGGGEIQNEYRTDDQGMARLLINAITSPDRDQAVSVRVNVGALAGNPSEIMGLIISVLQVPEAVLLLRVKRPVVYLISDEKSMGVTRTDSPLSSRLKNLLANNGFEFTSDRSKAELVMEVRASSEKGSVSGSIYIVHLSAVIRVSAAKEGRDIYLGTLDRVRGYGLDYNRSSQDAFEKAAEIVEKERFAEMMNAILK